MAQQRLNRDGAFLLGRGGNQHVAELVSSKEYGAIGGEAHHADLLGRLAAAVGEDKCRQQ